MGVRDAGAAETGLRVSQSLFVVLAAILVASLVVGPAEQLARALGAGAESAELAAARTVGQFVGFVLAAVGFLVVADDRDLVTVRTPSSREIGLVVGGVAVLLAVQFGLVFAAGLVGVEIGENQAITVGRSTPAYFLYMLPISVLIVGPAEELVFRGVVQGQLRRVFGPTVAIGVASALFGLIHVAVAGTLAQKFAYVAIAAVLGVGLGLVYERTGNLAVPAVTHGLYNATLFAVEYLQTTGVV